MRRRLSTFAAVIAVALTLAIGTDVSAQDEPTEAAGGAQSTVTSTVDNAADTVDEETDDSGRWGLLGLLGLAGLAGLLKRPTQTVVERDTTGRTGNATQR